MLKLNYLSEMHFTYCPQENDGELWKALCYFWVMAVPSSTRISAEAS